MIATVTLITIQPTRQSPNGLLRGLVTWRTLFSWNGMYELSFDGFSSNCHSFLSHSVDYTYSVPSNAVSQWLTEANSLHTTITNESRQWRINHFSISPSYKEVVLALNARNITVPLQSSTLHHNFHCLTLSISTDDISTTLYASLASYHLVPSPPPSTPFSPRTRVKYGEIYFRAYYFVNRRDPDFIVHL